MPDNQNYQRKDYLSWKDYFMSIAFLSAKRSKDPMTQVGACIVNNRNKIVGTGYNGMPNGCHDDLMPWNKEKEGTCLKSKKPYVCHAEMNAILNKNLADLTGCEIYVCLFPCNTCAKIIIQSGIKKVFYYSDKYHHKDELKASKYMFDMAHVKHRQYKPCEKKKVIDFDAIELTPDSGIYFIPLLSDPSIFFTDKTRNLGVYFDCNLLTEHHINPLLSDPPCCGGEAWVV